MILRPKRSSGSGSELFVGAETLRTCGTHQLGRFWKFERKIFILGGEILIFTFCANSVFRSSRIYQRKIVSPKGIFKKWSSHATQNRDFNHSYSIKSLRTSFFVFFRFQRTFLLIFRSFQQIFKHKETFWKVCLVPEHVIKDFVRFSGNRSFKALWSIHV